MYTAQYMNQEKMQNVLLGVLMVGLVLVGGGMYLFSTQLQSVATSVKGIQGSVAQLQVVKPVVATPIKPVINAINPVHLGKEMDRLAPAGFEGSFASRCVGEIQSAAQQDYVPYCIGTTQLVYTSAGSDFVISQVATPDLLHAVFLESIDKGSVQTVYQGLVPPLSVGAATDVVFAFGLNSCFSGTCDDGPTLNFVDFNILLKTIRNLSNFPMTYKDFVWGDQGKALYISSACGAGGCVANPIFMYDLAKDQASSVTTEKAAGIVGSRDENGKILAYWSGLRWDEQLGFSVDLNHVNGSVAHIQFHSDGIISSEN